MKKILKIFVCLFFFSETLAQQIFFPSEVKNVVATPGDKKIELEWDEAFDKDGIIVGYKIYYGTKSVASENQSYDDEIRISAKTNYTLKNLINGVEYFIGITAIDEEDNESETYSKEISAAPKEKNQKNGPKIISVTQISEKEIEIKMSTAVAKMSSPNSFIVEENGTLKSVPLQKISVDGKIVKLTAKKNFEIAQKYRVIATSAVEDLDGNPVISGVTDNLKFIGKKISTEKTDQNSTTENSEKKIKINSVNFFETGGNLFGELKYEIFDFAQKKGNWKIYFSEKNFSEKNLPATNFSVKNLEKIPEKNYRSILNFPAAALNFDTKYFVLLEFDDSGKKYFSDKKIISTPKKKSKNSEKILEKYGPQLPKNFSEKNKNKNNVPKFAAGDDKIAPSDATNLQFNSAFLKNKKIIILNWEKSKNIYDDVADQILFVKKNGKWDGGTSIGRNLESMEFDVEFEKNYEIKIVTTDFAGNSSPGAKIKFSTFLNRSGGDGWVVALAVAVILALFFRPRKIN